MDIFKSKQWDRDSELEIRLGTLITREPFHSYVSSSHFAYVKTHLNKQVGKYLKFGTDPTQHTIVQVQFKRFKDTYYGCPQSKQKYRHRAMQTTEAFPVFNEKKKTVYEQSVHIKTAIEVQDVVALQLPYCFRVSHSKEYPLAHVPVHLKPLKSLEKVRFTYETDTGVRIDLTQDEFQQCQIEIEYVFDWDAEHRSSADDIEKTMIWWVKYLLNIISSSFEVKSNPKILFVYESKDAKKKEAYRYLFHPLPMTNSESHTKKGMDVIDDRKR